MKRQIIAALTAFVLVLMGLTTLTVANATPTPTPTPTPTSTPTSTPTPAGSVVLEAVCVPAGGEADVVLTIDVDETFLGEYEVITLVDGSYEDDQWPAADGSIEFTVQDGSLVESLMGALPDGLEDVDENWIYVTEASLTVDCPLAEVPTETPAATPTPTPTPTPTSKVPVPVTRVDVSSPATVTQTGF